MEIDQENKMKEELSSVKKMQTLFWKGEVLINMMIGISLWTFDHMRFSA